VKSGADFAELAKKNLPIPVRKFSGDLGYFQGGMVAEFEQAAFSQP
jgi:parvulin-like peptidyl-prolyl isomerase